MWKHTYKALIVGIVLSVCFSARASTDTQAERTKIEFANGSYLVFSQILKATEEKAFGPRWKRAIFIDGSGSQIPLFPMEFFTSMNGLIFDETYPPRISPSGKYAVLDVLRTGIIDLGPSGSAENSSRQYCPVLNTASGCIVSMQTGELCGGNWSQEADEWVVTGYVYDATKAMVGYEFSGANDLWSQFLQSLKLNSSPKIKQYLADNLGAENLMTCEPPTSSNRESYALIARRLIKEGDRADATYIEKKLAAAAIDSDQFQDLMIKVGRTYLYDLPDSKAKTKLYLVRGDAVKSLDKSGEDWVRIEYIEKNGAVIDKWIRTMSIK